MITDNEREFFMGHFRDVHKRVDELEEKIHFLLDRVTLFGEQIKITKGRVKP